MKRYDLENYEDSISIMYECSDGDWVDYDEVQSDLRLLASAVLEAHSKHYPQAYHVGCEACRVAREVMGGLV